jgi:uncharacterized protein (DUF849 family)
MHFLDGALLPENQEKLVITAAPYGPQWEPGDFPSDIPVTIEEQVQKAVDCYNAGGAPLACPRGRWLRLQEPRPLQRASRRIKQAVPDMIIQVGGSISFASSRKAPAEWLSDETRHMLARLQPTPEQVTVAINTGQMNTTEIMTPRITRAPRSSARRSSMLTRK